MHTGQVTQNELKERQLAAMVSVKNLRERLNNLDKEAKSYEEYLKQSNIYKSCYSLMAAYKKASDKAKFKKEHFKEFKDYDYAKSYLTKFKGEDGKLPNPDMIAEQLEELKIERAVVYTDYQNLKAQANNIIQSANNERPMVIKKENSLYL